MNCLDCGHDAGDHADSALAECTICPCDTLHLDVGDCVPDCGDPGPDCVEHNGACD